MIRERASNNDLFLAYRNQCKYFFDWVLSSDDYLKFIAYCERGEIKNDVKPILNPINLYAFGTGKTSDEATESLYK